MSNTVKLNLINQAIETNNPNIYIYTHKVDSDSVFGEKPWRNVQNLGTQSSHYFTYTHSPLRIAYKDASGNISQQLIAEGGSAFKAVRDKSGDVIQALTGIADDTDQIFFSNELSDPVDVLFYRDGCLCKTLKGVLPNQSSHFNAYGETSIYLTVEKSSHTSTVYSESYSTVTKIELKGIQSADILLQGGEKQGFTFTLANVVES